MKPERAKRLVKAGRAIWTGDTRIKLTHLSDEQIDKVNQFLAKARGYDWNAAHSMSNRKQIQGLPCIKADMLLIKRNSRG